MSLTVRVTALLLLLGSVAASTACGTDKSSTSPAASRAAEDGSATSGAAAEESERDPCSMLTNAEIKAIVGLDVGSQKRPMATLCQYSATADSIGGVFVNITFRKMTLAEFEGDVKTMKEKVAELGVGSAVQVPVPGLGDAAYYFQPPSELLVLKDGIRFSVTDYYTKGKHEGMLPTLRPLAEKVIARL
ncbi:MAG TPA: DUF3558 family protein [Micromonosporaceae bacterium]|nr:DUF3558 family protein [Micromonosporaceae bacterium]